MILPDNRRKKFRQQLKDALHIHDVVLVDEDLAIPPDKSLVWHVTVRAPSWVLWPIVIRFPAGTDPSAQTTLEQLVARLVIRINQAKR